MKEHLKILFSKQHDKKWDAWNVAYEIRQLRRESEHLLKKSKERALSSWESNRISSINQEIGILTATATNYKLEQLLAA